MESVALQLPWIMLIQNYRFIILFSKISHYYLNIVILVKIGGAITLTGTVIRGGGGRSSVYQCTQGQAQEGADKEGKDSGVHLLDLEDWD